MKRCLWPPWPPPGKNLRLAALLFFLPMDVFSPPPCPAAQHEIKKPLSLPDIQQPWWPSRYGPDDQIGTLNEIKPDTVRSAAGLVRQGKVVDPGRVLDENSPKFSGRYWHQTVDTSAYFTNLNRPDASGKGWGKNRINWITEVQSGTFQAGTQLDSIGHIQIGDRFYNGWTAREVVEQWGLNRFGMETVPPVVTRGVSSISPLTRMLRGWRKAM